MGGPRRSVFRPCIDLHDGQVKQIVGGTLSESDPGALRTNFVARSVGPRADGDLDSWRAASRPQILRGSICGTG
jgi:hypothetical protein